MPPGLQRKPTATRTRFRVVQLNLKWFDGLGEYVIDWRPDCRIYLAKDDDTR